MGGCVALFVWVNPMPSDDSISTEGGASAPTPHHPQPPPLRDGGRANMLSEKGCDAIPGVVGGCGVVVAAFVVEEGVFGAGVYFDVVGDVVVVQFDVEFLAVGGGEVFVGVGADDGAHAGDGFDGAGVHAVEWGNGFEAVVGAGPGDGEAAAQAEADGSQALAVNAGLFGEVGQGGFQVMDAAVVEGVEYETAHETEHADDLVAAVEEIDGEGDVACAGQAA